jgi:pimeloyl-ACP methyl ester carboxylesterase
MNGPLSFFSLLQEFRAMGEFAGFAHAAWGWGLYKRTDHPKSILLIPGFLAGDSTLYPFANWLRSRGHRVFFSGMMANLDCPKRAVERLERILAEQYQREGGRLVIIGHSLGGVYARELARRHPQQIDQIILMGSPIHEPMTHANPYVVMVARLTRRLHNHHDCDLQTLCGVNGSTPPPDVLETLIYSKQDGVVNWLSCIEQGPTVETIEVGGTHVGLPYNLKTLRVIEEKLEGPPPLRKAMVKQFPITRGERIAAI